MKCSFSGEPVAVDKLFVLYYPPAAAHETWDKSYYAAASAKETLAATRDHLEKFVTRHVIGSKLLPGVLVLAAGLAVLAAWAAVAVPAWSEHRFAVRYLVPLAGLALVLGGRPRVRAFLERWRIWKGGARDEVAAELDAIRGVMASLPEDPDAEEAAAVMRRACPDSLSAIAFHGNNFRAFTYMDFVLSPKLRHPSDEAELPTLHSLYRDAYYVGEVVYDNWRMFHKDRRLVVDPRFAGSGGRRGVI